MKKRVMAVLLTASMLVGLLAGCATSGSGGSDSGDSKSSEGKVTLKFLNKYPEDPYAQYFVDAVAQFEKENPDIDIEMENVSDEAMKDKLSVISSGGEMPDIYFTWTGERTKRFARNDKALDLTPYFEEDPEWKESFLPAFFNNATYEGKTYAVPFRTSIMYMIYNKQVFKEYDLEIPETWDEFISICDKLNGTEVTPIAFGNSQAWYSSWWIGLLNTMMVSSEVINKDYTPETGEFTDKMYVEALQTFLDMNEKGYFGDHVNSKDYYQVREQFCAGQAAMMLDATAQFTQFRIPFATFLIMTFYKDISVSLDESAFIDGAKTRQVFWKIIMPLSKPIIASCAIVSFRAVWNELMFANVLLESTVKKTIPVGLVNLQGTTTTNWTMLMAGMVIASVPLVIIFLILQKQFIRGLTAGGVKG